MSVRSRLRSWWRAIVLRSRTDDEVDAELSFHLDVYAEDLMRAGVAPEEARRLARLELGAPIRQKEDYRASVGLRLWDDLLADLRYAARQLRRSPAFTATVLLVLALGIGANAAMFTVIDSTLLRWLPYHRPGRLASLDVTDAKGKPGWMFLADIEEWQRQNHTLEGLAYYSLGLRFVETPSGGRNFPTTLAGSNLFAVLGVQPKMGRDFLPEDQVPGQDKVVVLSEPAWKGLFAADPEIVGKQVRLNDEPYTVIGVMPASFLFPANDVQPQIWIPATISENSRLRDLSSVGYSVIVRLRDDVAWSTVETDLTGIQKRLVPLYAARIQDMAASNVRAIPYRDTLVKDAEPVLKATMMAVGIIWLIACANVSSLILARGVARQKELAVRGALGASRNRIVRQLFTESLLLSFIGSTAGVILAQVALRAFSRTLRTTLHLPEYLAPNPAVIAALVGLSVLSAVLFGFFPALLAARLPIELSLRQDASHTGHSRQRKILQQSIVIGEIGLSLVLLVSCGLMLRTIFLLRRVPLGFRTDHVVLLDPKLPTSWRQGTDVARAVYRPLLERVQRLNGVEAASLTTIIPLRREFDARITFYVSHSQNSTEATRIDAKLMAAGPDLQRVLGFGMYRGRFFNDQDTAESPPVAVVNRAFANLFGVDHEIIGQFKVGLSKERQATVVGVMDDFHQASIDRPSIPEIDFCATQLRQGDHFYQPTMQAHVELAVRTSRDPALIIPELRRAMTAVAPELQDSVVETMDQVVEDSMGSQLLAAHLLELFAGSALVVALAGLYGLLMYLVTQRSQELGVRMALGAQRLDIIMMLLLQAGRLLLTGALIGVALSYFATRLLATFLYGVGPHDVLTMVAVTVLLLLCGLLAAYIPARRASRVDPMKALRAE